MTSLVFSTLGLHYISSLRRGCLHTLARAFFLDAASSGDAVPRLHIGLIACFVDILGALMLFSGDGRDACIEVVVRLLNDSAGLVKFTAD